MVAIGLGVVYLDIFQRMFDANQVLVCQRCGLVDRRIGRRHRGGSRK